jgi:hypothetical protein
MDMRAAFTRINSSYTKDFPTPLKHNKMRDRGNYRLFWSGHHPPVHQGAKEEDRACLDSFVEDELAQRDKHIFAVIDPHDKDPAELTFRILHIIRFPFWYSYGLCGFISYMITAKMAFKLLPNVRE